MRILQVTHRFVPKYLAGTEVYASQVAERLAKRGHAVRVFTGDPSATSAETTEWRGLPVTSVPWGLGRGRGPVSTFLAGFLNPAVERQFEAVCADFRPEVVHIHHLLGLSPRLPGLARRQGARVAVTLHDYWFVCSNTWLFRWNRQLCPGPGRGYYCAGCALHRLKRAPQPALMTLMAPLFALRTAVLRRALLRADRLICPSRVVLERYAAQGIPRERMVVVPHGVQSGPDGSPPPAAPQTDHVSFAYVGSLIPPKGVHVAIQAFNRLSNREARLDIYGDPAADPDYAAELRALATHPGVTFHGPVARDRLEQALHAAHVVLLPSLWDEPFSITIDEALRARRPVMASDRGAPKERILPGSSGWLLPAGDVGAWHRQMQLISDQPDQLTRLQHRPVHLKQLDEHVGELLAIFGQESPNEGTQ